MDKMCHDLRGIGEQQRMTLCSYTSYSLCNTYVQVALALRHRDTCEKNIESSAKVF